MTKKYRVLIMGASYGSLLATKLGLAGHTSHLICLPAEADLQVMQDGAGRADGRRHIGAAPTVRTVMIHHRKTEQVRHPALDRRSARIADHADFTQHAAVVE